MSASLVGSEMCIRDREEAAQGHEGPAAQGSCGQPRGAAARRARRRVLAVRNVQGREPDLAVAVLAVLHRA
eukprot:346428-Alexandrium_andersonii.AAC.1